MIYYYRFISFEHPIPDVCRLEVTTTIDFVGTQRDLIVRTFMRYRLLLRRNVMTSRLS